LYVFLYQSDSNILFTYFPLIILNITNCRLYTSKRSITTIGSAVQLLDVHFTAAMDGDAMDIDMDLDGIGAYPSDMTAEEIAMIEVGPRCNSASTTGH